MEPILSLPNPSHHTLLIKGEKGGRQRLRVVGIRWIRRADRLRLAASSTNTQAEDALEDALNEALNVALNDTGNPADGRTIQ